LVKRYSGYGPCELFARRKYRCVYSARTVVDCNYSSISSSPPYTCKQLELWIGLLGAREFDEETTQNAAAWAAVLFHDHKLKSGRQWLRVQSPDFFRDALQVPPVYAQMFWETIVRDDVVVADVQTPVVNCAPGARDADLSFSSLDSSVWRELLTQNVVFNREMQGAMCVNMRAITRDARRAVGTPPPLEGAKPTVTQFVKFVAGISLKFSTHNCNTSMALDLWLKDMRMTDHARESSMNADEKLRLWEVIHSLIDKALLDTPHADVHSSEFYM